MGASTIRGAQGPVDVCAPAVLDRQTSSHRFGMHADCLLTRLSDKHRPGAEPLV